MEPAEAPIQELAGTEVPWVQSPWELQLGAAGAAGELGPTGALSAELGLAPRTQVGVEVGSDGAEGELGALALDLSGFDLAAFGGVGSGWSGEVELGVGAAAGWTAGPVAAVASGGVDGLDAWEPWFGGALIGSVRAWSVIAEARWDPAGWLGAAGVRARPAPSVELALDALGQPGGFTARAAVVVELELAGER